MVTARFIYQQEHKSNMPANSKYPTESSEDFMKRMMGKEKGGGMVKAANRFMRTQSEKEGKKEAEKY